MALSPIPGPAFRSRTFSNIQPFTYEDGLTVAEVISRWLAWFRENVMPVLNEGIPGEIDRLEALIADLQAQVDSNDVDIIDINVRIDDLADMVQSIIDNSIEAQDPVVAGLVNDSLSQTGAALRALFPRKVDLPYVNIADYGATLDGTNDIAAITAAYGAVSPGGTVSAPTGATLGLAGLDLAAKNVTLDFSSNTIVQTANEPVITVRGAYEDVKPCTWLSSNVRTTTLGFPDAPGVQPGDVLKVFSSDNIPDDRNSDQPDGAKAGRIVQVHDVTGNEIRVMPAVPDYLRTDVRVARLGKQSATVKVGEMYCAEADQDTFNTPMVAMVAMVRPRADVRVTRGGAQGIHVSNCYMGDIRIDVSNLADDPSTGHLGYGAADGAGSLNRYTITASNMRHAFTDGVASNSNPDNGDPLAYGASYGATVTVRANDVINGTVDTHHAGQGHHFVNCRVDGAGSAFSLRGSKHTISNAVVENSNLAVRIFRETSYAPTRSWGHTINNMVAINVGTGIEFTGNTSRPETNYPEIVVNGGKWEVSNKAFNFNDTVVVLNNPTFIYNQVTPPVDGHMGMMWNTRIMGGGYFDLTQMDATQTPAMFALLNAGSSNFAALVGEFTIDKTGLPADRPGNVLQSSDTTAMADFKVTVIGTIPDNWNPISGSPSPGRMAQVRVAGSENGSAGSTKAHNENGPLNLASQSDPVVYYLLTNTTGAPTFINLISPGYIRGQLLIIGVDSGSTRVKITPSAGNVDSGGVEVNIAPSTNITLVWNGSTWTQVTV